MVPTIWWYGAVARSLVNRQQVYMFLVKIYSETISTLWYHTFEGTLIEKTVAFVVFRHGPHGH